MHEVSPRATRPYNNVIKLQMRYRWPTQLLTFSYLMVISDLPASRLGLYSSWVLFVSSFDSNVAAFCMLFLFSTKLLTHSVHSTCARQLVLYVSCTCVYMLVSAPGPQTSLPLSHDFSQTVQKSLVTSLEGPSLLHGTSFLILLGLFYPLLATHLLEKQTLFMRFKQLPTAVLCLSLFTFTSGAFWANFSAIWGNWYNSDPVEVFYLFLFLFTVKWSHSKTTNQLAVKVFSLLVFFFLILLRAGFFNSKHSSGGFSQLADPDS